MTRDVSRLKILTKVNRKGWKRNDIANNKIKEAKKENRE
jgi:hypothetical protein